MDKMLILFSFLILFSKDFLLGQNLITLNDAIQYALEHSHSINISKLNLQSSESALEAVNRGLMTSVGFEADIPRYFRSLKSQFNLTSSTEEFYELGSTIMEGRLSINQPLIFSNGLISVTGSLFARDQIAFPNTKRDYYSNMSIRFRQPIFGFNSLEATKKKAELNLARSLRNYSKTEVDLIYSITFAFYEVYKTKQEQEILKEKTKQIENAYESIANKNKAGLVPEVEAMQLEVDLAASRNDLLVAETALAESKSNLKLIAGYKPMEDIDVVWEPQNIFKEIDLDTAVAYALQNRPEILDNQADIVTSQLNVEEISARGKISGLLTANYGINKNDNHFGYVFSHFLNDRSITLTLQVPVWDWGKNFKETESAEANFKIAKLNEENQKITIRKEIEMVFSLLQTARARLSVLRKSIDLAQKSYNISLSRFNSGDISSFELSQVQLKLTNAKLNGLRSLLDYLIALADLQRKTLHVF